MSLGERPRGSARPTPNEHYNSLPRTSIEGALGLRLCSLADSILIVLIAARVRQVAYIRGFLGVTSMLLSGQVRRISLPHTRVNNGTSYPWSASDCCLENRTILPSTTRTTVVPTNSSRFPVAATPSSSPVCVPPARQRAVTRSPSATSSSMTNHQSG